MSEREGIARRLLEISDKCRDRDTRIELEDLADALKRAEPKREEPEARYIKPAKPRPHAKSAVDL